MPRLKQTMPIAITFHFQKAAAPTRAFARGLGRRPLCNMAVHNHPANRHPLAPADRRASPFPCLSMKNIRRSTRYVFAVLGGLHASMQAAFPSRSTAAVLPERQPAELAGGNADPSDKRIGKARF